MECAAGYHCSQAAVEAAINTLNNVLKPLSTISSMLAATATPAVPYVSAGDLGLYAAVANHPGRALASLTMQVTVPNSKLYIKIVSDSCGSIPGC